VRQEYYYFYLLLHAELLVINYLLRVAYSEYNWVILNARDTSRQGKFLKILRIEIENYSHHHDNGNVSNRTSMGIDLFNTNLLDEIQILVRLIGRKNPVYFGHLGKIL
jgi:hypothetical protein